jgi:probable F420-dependent oxidoreductase
MKLGFHLIGLGPRSFAAVAKKADEAGFGSLGMQEHLVFPVTITPTYPYSDTGYPAVDASTQYYDVWVSLAYMAAVTSQIRLTTAAYILPLRNPFVTARALVTLDRLSWGRVTLGAGIGWLKEEFEVAGMPWAQRGKRTDELIDVLKKLWTEPTIEHHGRFYNFGPVKFEPKPVQKPHIPIHIGGDTPAAKGRAARLGDGWFGAKPMSPEKAKEVVAELGRLRREAGRADAPFEVTLANGLENTLDSARRYAEAGVDTLIVRPAPPEGGRLTVPYVEEFFDRMSQEVISKL